MKQTAKKLIAILLVLALVLGLSGCTTYSNFKTAFIDKKDPDEIDDRPLIKIGVLEPLTGTDSVNAAKEIAGIELAHKLYPMAFGRDVELVYADNMSDVSMCVEAAQSLIDQELSFIIGSYKSVLTLAASDVIKEAGIPAIAATNTNPLVTKTNNCYFRVCIVDSFEGESAANYVFNGLQTTNTAIFRIEGNDYASAMASAYEEALEAVSGEESFIKTVTVPKNTEDYVPYLNQLKALGAEIVFFPENAQVAKPILLQAAAAELDINWLGTSRWDELDVEGIRFTLDYDPEEEETPMAASFKKAFEENYPGQQPSMMTALGFDAYLLALNAIYKAGPDASSDEYIEALSNINEMPGVTGSITMSAGGDPIKEIIVEQYKNGDSKAIYRAVPEQTVRSE